MNSAEFITELRGKLHSLPNCEIDKTVSFYVESIDDRIEDGMSEEAAVASLGGLDAIAQEILKDLKVNNINKAPQGGACGRALVERQLSIENLNKNIVIKDENVPIYVSLSNDDQVHFIYFEREKQFYRIDNGNSIVFEKVSTYRWHEKIFNIDIKIGSFTILLPAKYSGSLDLHTCNTKISLRDIWVNNIDALTDNARIIISNVTAAGQARVKTSNSRIEASNTTIGMGLWLETDNGAVAMEDCSSLDLAAQTSNGKITACNVKSQQGIDLKTSNGRIEVRGVEAQNSIYLESNNGGISGNICGSIDDFHINSRTSNGKNNLPNRSTGGAKGLEVFTSNGTIAIEFAPKQ